MLSLDTLLAHASWIVACSLQGGLLVLWLCERLMPRRTLGLPRVPRWWQQLALHMLGGLLLRACVPVAAIGLAVLAEQRAWGLLHLAPLPAWLAAIAGVLLLDGGNYALHRITHAVPLLWRIHQVHHSDIEVDCATSLRHHPLEALVGQCAYLLLIAAFGISPLAVLLFTSVGLLHDLFTHANLALPRPLEQALRTVIVTPDLHHLHHSADHADSQSNFASLFSFWDRLFGSYRAAPAAGQGALTLGLASHRDPDELTLWGLLRLPFMPTRPADGHEVVLAVRRGAVG